MHADGPRRRFPQTSLLGADSFQGQFTQLLAPKPRDEEARKMSKMLLETMGALVAFFKSSES